MMFLFTTMAYDFGEYDLKGETVTLLMLEQTVPTVKSYFDGRGAGLLEETEEKFNCNIEIREYSAPPRSHRQK